MFVIEYFAPIRFKSHFENVDAILCELPESGEFEALGPVNKTPVQLVETLLKKGAVLDVLAWDGKKVATIAERN